MQITVIGDSQADKEKYEFCMQLGRLLAEMNITVITGGRSGVMEAVSKGAWESGGLTVGILPSDNKQTANPYCRIIIPTGLGHARNNITALAADVVIVIGGQAGTLTEMGFAWIYEKPILAVVNFDGMSRKFGDQKLDSRGENKIISVSSLDEIRTYLERFQSNFK